MTSRIQSLDILRGLIMVLMAIDHVRVFAGVPAGGADPAIFFTRWITHFCAPGFAFFAGTAAFLYGLKVGDKKQLARYLFTRGLMLVVLEFTVIRFGWTFNLNFSEFMLAGVIWMLGACMILLGLMVRLDAKVVGIIGLCIIFFQNLFAQVSGILPVSIQPYWEFIYSSGADGPGWIAILYVIVPWIGVMMAGYGFGLIINNKKWCYIIGLGAIAAFIVIGSFYVEESPFLLKLLNQRKYPASQLYLLMTLGPLIALVPLAEKATGAVANFFRVFGRVPFFYYLLHIPLIHVSAIILNLIVNGSTLQGAYATCPFCGLPPENVWSLWLLYLVFAIDVVILYFASKWYSDFKAKNSQLAWTKYI